MRSSRRIMIALSLAASWLGCAAPTNRSEPAPAEPATEPAKEELPMRRKQDARPPVFVDGPPVEPEEPLRRWIAERVAKYPRAVFRLPFTFRGPATNRAALGVPPGDAEGWLHRLDDSALGVALAERIDLLRRAEPAQGAGRCVVWLSVRVGPLFGVPEPGGLPVMAVLAVHERLADDAAGPGLTAQAARGDDCLAVRLLPSIHCARGPARCQECQAAQAEPATPALLDLCPDGPAARPTIAVEREGKTTYAAFDVLEWFASVDEARAFAAAQGLTDVRLDPEER